MTVWFDIAGVHIGLTEPDQILARLDALYREFATRLNDYAANTRNTVLCRAGCSHCCRSGGFFAMTLVEALRLNRATRDTRAISTHIMERARRILDMQRGLFAQVDGPPDAPGARDESTFSKRVSHVTAMHPACPLLHEDLCMVYADRPFLCRAYGYATDAYAVEAQGAMVFRSLCVLYESVQLHDYVQAKELRAELFSLSRELTGGRDVGRFTLPEAILAKEM